MDYERIYKWQSAWNMFKRPPMARSGVRKIIKLFYMEISAAGRPESENPMHAHNNFLHVLAEKRYHWFCAICWHVWIYTVLCGVCLLARQRKGQWQWH